MRIQSSTPSSVGWDLTRGLHGRSYARHSLRSIVFLLCPSFCFSIAFALYFYSFFLVWFSDIYVRYELIRGSRLSRKLMKRWMQRELVYVWRVFNPVYCQFLPLYTGKFDPKCSFKLYGYFNKSSFQIHWFFKVIFKNYILVRNSILCGKK